MNEVGGNREDLRPLGVAGFAGVAVWQIIAALHFLLREGKVSFALSSIGSALALILGVLVCWRPQSIALLGRRIFGRVTWALGFAWIIWAAIGLMTIFVVRARDWDECCYLLSGLALRGYGTPYFADKPPVTHIIAALFAGAPQFINAFLLIVLVGLLSLWGIRRWGWSLAALPLLMLATQNTFLDSLIEIMAELPASVLLILGFFLLTRERLFVAGVVFAICGLTRWNLAIMPLALALVIPFRLGWRAFGRYAAGGLAVAAIFLAASFALVENPLGRIIHGSLMISYDWAGSGEVKPDLLRRAYFYSSHAFFLTPFAALAVVAFLSRATSSVEDWVIRTAMPIGIVSYAVAMINIGGLVPRFMAPIIPLAFIILTEFASQLCVKLELSRVSRPTCIALIGVVTAAWGFWPADVFPRVRHIVSLPALFSAGFRRAAMANTAQSDVIDAPPILPVSDANGYPVAYVLRRTVNIPNARRDSTDAVLPASDVHAASIELVRSVPNGAIVLLPKGEQGTADGAILASDAEWLLIRLSK